MCYSLITTGSEEVASYLFWIQVIAGSSPVFPICFGLDFLWSDKGAAKCYILSDMRDGYISGIVKGFCIAIKVELTDEERNKIDEHSHQRKLKQAKEELELAQKRVKLLLS